MIWFSFFLKFFLIILYALNPVLNLIRMTPPAVEVSYQSLGIPLSSDYREGIPARTAWDIEICNGKLFVGGGDYDANSGPVPIYEYDLLTEKWKKSASLPDEQISRFIPWGDGLIAPGCDPRQDWTFGNVYIYDGDSWQTKRTIPGGIHQFDIVQFNGRMFVGLGVAPGEFPIAVSDDGGDSFQSVTMYKDGAVLDTSAPDGNLQIRVYDFFVLNNALYALYFRYDGNKTQMEIYKYQNGSFYYYSNLPMKLSYRYRINFDVVTAKAELNGKMYFSTGKLYVSEDMINVSQINLGTNAVISDLRVIEGKLFACVITPEEDGTYRTSIWQKSPYGDIFSELIYFTFPSPAQSFTYHNGTIYFGMGDGTISKSNPMNGSILRVSYPLS